MMSQLREKIGATIRANTMLAHDETLISALEAVLCEAMPQWTRTADCVPPEDGPYLVHAPSADPDSPLIAKAWWNAKGHTWDLIQPMWANAVTHWMPLPAPPES